MDILIINKTNIYWFTIPKTFLEQKLNHHDSKILNLHQKEIEIEIEIRQQKSKTFLFFFPLWTFATQTKQNINTNININKHKRTFTTAFRNRLDWKVWSCWMIKEKKKKISFKPFFYSFWKLFFFPWLIFPTFFSFLFLFLFFLFYLQWKKIF